MHWEQTVQHATQTDVGLRRKNNQDSFCVQVCSDQEVWEKFGHLYVVADGMGGHAVGELASKIAVDTIPIAFYKSRAASLSEAIVEAIKNANTAINERGTQNVEFNRMGTTCVLLVLSAEGAVFGHVGDSRAYRVRGDRIEQLTFDHSLHWELQRAGRLKPGDVFLPEAKHVITRSLGPESQVEVDIDGPFPVLPDDTFILCSDGLTGHVHDPEIGMICRELPPDEAAKLLVNLANLRGGSDNITVIVARAGAIPESADATARRRQEAAGAPSVVGVFWQMFYWLSLLVLGIGVGTLIVNWPDHRIPAAAFAAIGLVSQIGLIRHWLKRRESVPSPDRDRTVNAQAYRVASSRTTREFLAGLAKVERELRVMASEENWTIDWAAHDTAIEAARELLDQKKSGPAMSELGKAIDALMLGLHAHRKKLRIAQMVSQQDEKSDEKPAK
jgi:PPM family protein phosphatase